jgi:hypothetical protein
LKVSRRCAARHETNGDAKNQAGQRMCAGKERGNFLKKIPPFFFKCEWGYDRFGGFSMKNAMTIPTTARPAVG